MEKSVVAWLVEQVNSDCLNSTFIHPELVKKALEMEKKQIIKVFIDVSEVLLKGVDTEHQGKLKQAAEQYYNETYGNDHKGRN